MKHETKTVTHPTQWKKPSVAPGKTSVFDQGPSTLLDDLIGAAAHKPKLEPELRKKRARLPDVPLVIKSGVPMPTRRHGRGVRSRWDDTLAAMKVGDMVEFADERMGKGMVARALVLRKRGEAAPRLELRHIAKTDTYGVWRVKES
jgi:hypothetical protein